MRKEILIPFAAGFGQADNPETRARLKKMIEYISAIKGDYLILLSGGGKNKKLAASLFELIKKIDQNIPREKFIYEEESWDTATQVKKNIPIIKKNEPVAVVIFSNWQHCQRISLLFRRHGIKTKKIASPTSYPFLYKAIYILFYEPVIFLATLLYLDGLISGLTRKRLKQKIN